MRNILAITALGALALGACKKSDGGTSPDKADHTGAKVTSTMSPTATPTEATTEVPITSSSPEAVGLYKQARDLWENHRRSAAREILARAVELDPDFALAHALYGEVLPKAEGKAHFERAGRLAAGLPETERLLVIAMTAGGDEAAAALNGLADKAAGDWRVQMMVARKAQYTGDVDSAEKAFEKASRLNPEAPYPHNNLAYIYAERGDWDAAIAAVKRYAEMAPGEPNPLDTKGEILMLAGKLEKAEAAFRGALEIEPGFAIAHEGVAATRFHRDDWAGGIAELEKAVDIATGHERAKLAGKLAWAYVAAGVSDKADAAFAAARELRGGDPALAEIEKAEVALHREAYKKAARLAAAGVEALARGGAPAKKLRWGQTLETIALARAGDTAAANERLAALAGDGDDHYVHLARGHVLLAGGKPAAAIEALDNLDDHKYFRSRAALLTAEALEKAGKADKARALRAELAGEYRRDIHAILIRAAAEKAGDS